MSSAAHKAAADKRAKIFHEETENAVKAGMKIANEAFARYTKRRGTNKLNNGANNKPKSANKKPKGGGTAHSRARVYPMSRSNNRNSATRKNSAARRIQRFVRSRGSAARRVTASNERKMRAAYNRRNTRNSAARKIQALFKRGRK